MIISEILKRDAWAGAEGTHNGLPLIIRFRPEFSQDSNLQVFPQLLQVYWEFGHAPSGMPSQEESEAMQVFEDRLVNSLESVPEGALTAVVTTNGYREWVLYAKSVESFSEHLHHMPQESDPYPIEIETDFDPNWDYFFQNIRPNG